MADHDRHLEIAERNITHGCRVAYKLLRADGCDDPDAVIARALMEAAVNKLPDLERVGLVEKLEPANDCAPYCGCREFSEDILE